MKRREFKQTSKTLEWISDGMEKALKEANFSVSPEFKAELGSLHIKPPQKPDFPFVIFLFAALKDALDSLDFSIFLIVITTMFSIGIGGLLWFWMLGKTSFFHKALLKWFVRRYVFVFIIELIPGVKILPMASILVIMTHFRETKMVKIIYKTLEELRRTEKRELST